MMMTTRRSHDYRGREELANDKGKKIFSKRFLAIVAGS